MVFFFRSARVSSACSARESVSQSVSHLCGTLSSRSWCMSRPAMHATNALGGVCLLPRARQLAKALEGYSYPIGYTGYALPPQASATSWKQRAAISGSRRGNNAQQSAAFPCLSGRFLEVAARAKPQTLASQRCTTSQACCCQLGQRRQCYIIITHMCCAIHPASEGTHILQTLQQGACDADGSHRMCVECNMTVRQSSCAVMLM